MVKHTCEICNKIFEKKSHFIQHLNKKKPCGPLISKKNLVPPKIPPNSPQIPPKNPLISNLGGRGRGARPGPPGPGTPKVAP